MFLELSIGQYTRRGPIGALGRICPIFQGAGFATVVISFWLATYYNVIISWAMYYLVSSFQDPLPWISCNNTWTDDSCLSVSPDSNFTSIIKDIVNVTEIKNISRRSSTQQFYE